jgi:pyrimidine operon attenuation protein/uracil phosphoribosyltransferase
MNVLLDDEQIQVCLRNMAQQIATRPDFRGPDGSLPALVGIRRGGDTLTQRLLPLLQAAGMSQVDVGALDITMYRDDLSTRARLVVPYETDISFPVDDRVIVLLDDVLNTGRSVRAALDALVAFGRPRAIRLVTLIDRGGRDYPIAADVVGKTVSVPATSQIQVKLQPHDVHDVVLVTAS